MGYNLPTTLTPYLHLPAKLVLDPVCRSPLVILILACCVPRSYYNVRTQCPVALETVHNWFLPCAVCSCAKWIWKADGHIEEPWKCHHSPLCTRESTVWIILLGNCGWFGLGSLALNSVKKKRRNCALIWLDLATRVRDDLSKSCQFILVFPPSFWK